VHALHSRYFHEIRRSETEGTEKAVYVSGHGSQPADVPMNKSRKYYEDAYTPNHILENKGVPVFFATLKTPRRKIIFQQFRSSEV
jgi:hypothetical protein